MKYTCPYCDRVHEDANAACCGEVGHMQDPAAIALRIHKRLHAVHQLQNPNHALTTEIGKICIDLLELVALLQDNK